MQFYASEKESTLHQDLALANSIGMGTEDLEATLRQIKKGLSTLLEGQLLFVSLYGKGNTNKEIIDDFVYLAKRVAGINTHGIELNLSCPNVYNGFLYENETFVYNLVRAVSQSVAIPITVKVGLFKNKSAMCKSMHAIREGGAGGITGTQMSAHVLNEKQVSFFGQSRAYAGIGGNPLRPYALKWLRDAVFINKKDRLDLTILAGGGITNANYFNDFLSLGAHVACSATGAMFNPYIASEYHNKYGVLHEKEQNVQPVI